MVIHSENMSGTASSGALSTNTVAALQGIAREIIISPATSTTTYNLTITNDNSLDVFISNSITGDFIEEVALPFRGIYTVAISEATKDELFKMAIVVEE
jgi:hypothetical protein